MMIMYVLSVACTLQWAVLLAGIFWFLCDFSYTLIATAVGAIVVTAAIVVAVVVAVFVIDIAIYFNFMPFINCNSIVFLFCSPCGNGDTQ